MKLVQKRKGIFIDMTYYNLYSCKNARIHCFLISHLDNNLFAEEIEQSRVKFFASNVTLRSNREAPK